MTRGDVPPKPLDLELAEEGIYVQYRDDRRVFYNGVPEIVTGTLRCQPGKVVQVLVTDDSGTEGVLTYVNERKTEDEILADSGVGRVYLDPGETRTIFEGVQVAADGVAVEVSADLDAIDGRVFVFEEDELGESAYELRAAD